MAQIQNIQTFNEQIRRYVTQVVDQNTNAFNQTGSGIVLAGVTPKGSHELRSFVKDLSGTAAAYRRDPSSTASKAATPYDEGLEIKVKVAGGYGPISVPKAVLMWSGEGAPNAEVAQALNALAIQYAALVIKDQLNTSLAAAGAALEANANVKTDLNNATPVRISQENINTALAKFGDRSSAINTLVMHSGAHHGLIGNAIANANNLFEIGGVAVREGIAYGQGRKIIVTDAPALAYTNAASRAVYKVLGLVPGAIEVTNPKQVTSLLETQGHNIGTTWQANYDFMVGVLGYNFDAAISYPTDAEIATGANWTKQAVTDKNTAGVCLIVNQ